MRTGGYVYVRVRTGVYAYVPVITRANKLIYDGGQVCTLVHWCESVRISVYALAPVGKSTYAYVSVCTRTYWGTRVGTGMYACVSLHTCA